MTEDFKISLLNPGKKHFAWCAAIIAIIMLFMASGAAINIDEILHYNHAKKVLSWYETMGKDTTCLDTPKSNLKYYGQSPDNLSALINRIFSIENEYQTRHYIGFVFSFLLILITGFIAHEISGSYLAGIVAMVLLLISPRPMGQAFGNLKDIPFAMGYAWSLLLILRIFKQMPNPGWKNIILLGLAIAFTNSIRIGGLVFYPYLILFLISWLFLFRKNNFDIIKNVGWWKQIIAKGIVVFIIGYFMSLIFWPFGLLNPIKNPLEALSVMEHYKISIKQIFEGTQIWSTNLPWYYLPKWFFISIPEIVIIGFLLFIGAIFYQKKHKKTDTLFQKGIVAFSFLFPIIYIIIIDSNLYSGWRQMYFIYTPLVVLSSLGIVLVFKHLKKPALLVATGLSLILIAIPIIHSVKNYPSEYIYFNSLAKLGNNTWSNYEYDYYWHEMKKAANWLEDELEGNNTEVKIASNFDITTYLYNKENIDFEYVHFYDKISVEWDYAILGVNYVHPHQLKNNTWQPNGVVKTFYHNGNPTIIILKGQDKNAFNGYSEFINGNFNLAISNLTKAFKNDPSDLNIQAYLGESYLALNNYEEMKQVVKEGKKLHPFYEPFLLLDAKLEIKQN
ncbi:MAG: phospholipid carrier-dependent glycosyltransferase, partial [Mariniphaga sp.]|nr:phospholipid carrier-dependent glycosyltransferase [Mariniphaga sp.]